jgi:hypothetical protein
MINIIIRYESIISYYYFLSHKFKNTFEIPLSF